MPWDKDIRFPEKKVDSSWKEEVSKKTPDLKETRNQPPQAQAPISPEADSPSKKTASSKTFLNLLSSFGYQGMMHMGEIPHPASGTREINLEAAQEAIALLQAIKEKTAGNLSDEENEFLVSLLSELQLKFASHV